MAVNTLIYEDNALLRESISSLVSGNPALNFLAAYEDVKQVEEQVKKWKPDLILMDIEMPGRSGIEATQLIRKSNAKVAIIILTVFDDSENVLNAIKAGASGYMLKKHISDRLFIAIEEVMEGGAPMSPGVARLVIQSMHKPANENLYQLTGREKEILTSLSKGNSYKMIASDLEISIDTVRTHIKRIYEKLQVHSQTEAVSKAINEGLVE
ncbi:MAG: response regulator transcription factor [Cyclobacteriaceae bacterium]|nr:response regulator transcription factor [Cyclobacteriaceae bacterium]